MNYKAYPKKKDTLQRMSRKHARGGIFVANGKMARLRRKARRLAKQELEQSE
jgi:hypothetical protein